MSLYSFLWELGICAELRSLDTAVDFNCGPASQVVCDFPVYGKKLIERLCLQERIISYNYQSYDLSDGHTVHSETLPAFLTLICVLLEADLGYFMLTDLYLLLHEAH